MRVSQRLTQIFLLVWLHDEMHHHGEAHAGVAGSCPPLFRLQALPVLCQVYLWSIECRSEAQQVSITWWCLYKNCCLAWVHNHNHVVTFTGAMLEEEGQLSCLLGYCTWCLIERVDRH
jgi:hypothetical protein